MANVTGAELNPIYQRLNQTPTYHPFNVDAFSDWSMEAGDIITVSRDGVDYSSPVHVSRMTWKGNAPTVQISSTGNKEREPVSRISRKKYGRGSAGIRSQEAIHKNFTSEDGILHSELHVTESYLRTEFHEETHSLRSYVDLTASHLQTAFIDEAHSLRSYVDLTASHLQTAFVDEVNSVKSYVDITASHLQTAFVDEVNSVKSYVDLTASHLQTVFTDDVNSLRGDVEVTASHMRTEFTDSVNSVRSEVRQTASSWEARVAPVSDANGNVTPASIALAVNNAGSSVKINANKIYLLGQTIADTIDADYIATALESVGSLLVHDVLADGIEASSVKIRPIAGMGAVNIATAYNGSSLTRSGDNYTLRLAKMNGQFDEWTFSRATTLSGAWSGRKFTVTASPQGDEFYTDLWSAVPASNVTWNGTVATLSLYATINGGETTYNAGTVTTDVASFLQDKTGATRKFTANGLYSADSGYIGFGSIEIDVPQSTVDPTTLSIQWNGSRRLNANASPQGVSRYTEIVSSVPNADITVSGTTLTLLLKATYDGGETTVNVGSVTANISGKLQSKTFTSNGTKTPDSGYIGFSSVSVSVPAADADARFGASSGQYFIGAYDNASGNLISGSNHTYKLGTSGAKVQVQKSDGTKYSSTPELALAIDSGSLNTSTGKRTVTVTAGGNDTTATLDITDYSAGKSAVTVSSVAVDGTITYSSKVLTVPTTATASNNATKTVNLSVDASLAYKAGWEAYYNKWKYPVAHSPVDHIFTIYWPKKDVDSAYDSMSRNYTLENKDNNTVYLRYGGTTYAEISHGKYTAGYNSARLSVNTSSKVVSITSSGSITSYTLALMQDSLITTSGNDYGKRKVWIKASPNTGSAVEVTSATLSDYRDGWSAAYSRVSLPGNNTSSGYMVVGTPPSTVGGAKVETTYTLDTYDNNVAYIKQGSSIKAQVTHNKYTAGYNKGVDDYYGDYLVPVWGERYQDNYNANQYKQSNGTFIRKIHASASTGVHIPLSEDGANAGSANLTEIPSGGITANGNYKFRSGYAGIRYLNVNVPTGSSHSISQSHAYADNLATLASNLGASGSSALTNLGTFPAAGGRNYWGIKVKCGSAVKYYYVHTT